MVVVVVTFIDSAHILLVKRQMGWDISISVNDKPELLGDILNQYFV